ncbi:SGNH/GDSL hydrolase family protein [Nonomuraea guangzhouensis]|uniref:SGNH/GDSL hydrolase family protein n=1 Tax=Nonomuraea guangzhouensis TaxID=1291555 RepID=A0ABW4G3X4_9ACTN|nr:SGNH/GDSL hydrolase family protein [Nonomuraea guangzhouensis]
MHGWPSASGSAAPVVMFVGDSFTVGSGPVPTWRTYAAESARLLGWQPVIAGAGGTGYLNKGRVGRTFRQSFEAELAWRPAPDLLIISGGHNDCRWSAESVRRAAEGLVSEARAHWPRTRIVMIGPIWLRDTPRKAYRVRDALSGLAQQEAIPFLDPLNEPRITGTPSGQLLPDRIHPTAEGHFQVARWLTDAIGRLPKGEDHQGP